MSPRPPKFAFYLDENFPQAAGKFFTKLGHRVYDGKHQIGFGGSDHEHLVESTRLGAIIVSFDKDFRVDKDLKARVAASPGVILIQSSTANLNDISGIITKLLKDSTPNKFNGKVCYASTDMIRFT